MNLNNTSQLTAHMKKMSCDGHRSVRFVGITDSFKSDHFEICLFFYPILWGLVSVPRLQAGRWRAGGTNVSHRSVPPSPSWAFFDSSNNLCPQAGTIVAGSLKGDENRNKDALLPLFPGNRTPVCVLGKCFSAPSFSLRVMIR